MIELYSEYLPVLCIWLCILVMSHTHFRVNPNSISIVAFDYWLSLSLILIFTFWNKLGNIGNSMMYIIIAQFGFTIFYWNIYFLVNIFNRKHKLPINLVYCSSYGIYISSFKIPNYVLIWRRVFNLKIKFAMLSDGDNFHAESDEHQYQLLNLVDQ